MSGPARFLQEVVNALPEADPVGCIVAAIHEYDTTTAAQVEQLTAERDRLLHEVAVARGVPPEVVLAGLRDLHRPGAAAHV